MAKIIGPDFIALQVRNLEASRTFYTEQLGLELAPQSPPHAVVFATSPIRSFMFASLVSVSFIRISSTISIERGAVKQTRPWRLPLISIMPAYSWTDGAPLVTR